VFASTSARTKSPVTLAAELVAAYVSNNPVPVTELPALIGQVHDAIADLASGRDAASDPVPDRDAASHKPSAAQIRNSVRPDGIVSFLDGRPYKTLKRHLTANGLHPQSYRERFGLPADYPMVAQEYAQRRSTLARAIGLGVPGGRAA
jgi:predicted transcriptional regulator